LLGWTRLDPRSMGWAQPSPHQLVTVHEHSNQLRLACRDVHCARLCMAREKIKAKEKGAEGLPREASAVSDGQRWRGGSSDGPSSSLLCVLLCFFSILLFLSLFFSVLSPFILFFFLSFFFSLRSFSFFSSILPFFLSVFSFCALPLCIYR